MQKSVVVLTHPATHSMPPEAGPAVKKGNIWGMYVCVSEKGYIQYRSRGQTAVEPRRAMSVSQ